jgi:hypothetical protein
MLIVCGIFACCVVLIIYCLMRAAAAREKFETYLIKEMEEN